MEDLFIFGIPIMLLAIGLFAGGYAERRHLRDLDRREAATRDMFVTQVKSFPGYRGGAHAPQIIFGEVVIGADYLKTFLAGIRNLFGGEIGSYETMLVRARREAQLRIVEDARLQGYNAVCNVRLETADIGGNAATQGKKTGLVMAAILASGTAYNVEAGGVPSQP
jgi:uncharacterized protein YbjQ (UPF0145 family)